MSKKNNKTVILDLTKHDYIAAIPCAHEGPAIKIFEFWNEKGEKINELERIKHDTEKIVIKTKKGIEPLKIANNMQLNLLEYFKFKNKKEFKEFTCHQLVYHMVHGSIDRDFKYKIKKTKQFEIGDTALLGTFINIFWKTITLDSEHSAICIAKTDEETLFISKLGNKEKVVVTTLSELQKVYWASRSCAKTIWK